VSPAGWRGKQDVRRPWQKCHLAPDADTGEIVASDLTGRRTPDCTRVPTLLEQIDNPVASLSADGDYGAESVCLAALSKVGGQSVRVLIPPGRYAQLNPSPSPAQRERNRNILSIRELGRWEWHKSSGYSGRAMVENAVFRYKGPGHQNFKNLWGGQRGGGALTTGSPLDPPLSILVRSYRCPQVEVVQDFLAPTSLPTLAREPRFFGHKQRITDACTVSSEEPL